MGASRAIKGRGLLFISVIAVLSQGHLAINFSPTNNKNKEIFLLLAPLNFLFILYTIVELW